MAKPFEKSKKDREPKGMKEGSKREEAWDAKQQKVKDAARRRGASMRAK